jgi:hypothetical protein
MVALEAHTHELLVEPEREDDLRGRRQQRDDPHAAMFTRAERLSYTGTDKDAV